MAKHIFFDLDSTLTPSRARMLPAHIPIFERLCKTSDVIVVTGGAQEQIQKQIPIEPTGNYFMLSQQGNYAIDKNGELLWHEQVSEEQERVVKKVAQELTSDFASRYNIRIPNPNDIWENRGSQFASSVLGFHAPNEEKYKLDPDQSKRRELLAANADKIKTLRAVGIEAVPAGTTTIDFILEGKNKGYNITRLNARMGWQKQDCLYIGDALFKGGNDETVIGVIPTQQVKDPEDTFRFIQENLLS